MIHKNEEQGTGAVDRGTGIWGIEPPPSPSHLLSLVVGPWKFVMPFSTFFLMLEIVY